MSLGHTQAMLSLHLHGLSNARLPLHLYRRNLRVTRTASVMRALCFSKPLKAQAYLAVLRGGATKVIRNGEARKAIFARPYCLNHSYHHFDASV